MSARSLPFGYEPALLRLGGGVMTARVGAQPEIENDGRSSRSDVDRILRPASAGEPVVLAPGWFPGSKLGPGVLAHPVLLSGVLVACLAGCSTESGGVGDGGGRGESDARVTDAGDGDAGTGVDSDGGNVDAAGEGMPDASPSGGDAGGAGCDASFDVDPENCGGCGVSCAGKACVDGICEPTVLVDGLYRPNALAVDDGHVYWARPSSSTISNNGTIGRVPKTGGSPSPVASSIDRVAQLVRSGDYLYFNDIEDGEGYQILRVMVGGGSPEVLATGTAWGINGLAVDGDHVYFTDNALDRILRVPVSGGAAEELATGRSNPLRVTVTSTHVYWVEGDPDDINGGVFRMSTGGGAPESVATMQHAPYAVTTGAGFVYWTNYGNATFHGAVVRAPLSGGSAEEIVTGQRLAKSIGVDDTHVYWTMSNWDGDRNVAVLRRAPLAGGAVEDVLVGDNLLRGLVVKDDAVYIATFRSLEATSGRVLRVPK